MLEHDHVFGLMHLLGFRFAPRIRDLGETKLYVPQGVQAYPTLRPLIGHLADDGLGRVQLQVGGLMGMDAAVLFPAGAFVAGRHFGRVLLERLFHRLARQGAGVAGQDRAVPPAGDDEVVAEDVGDEHLLGVDADGLAGLGPDDLRNGGSADGGPEFREP